MRALSLGAIHRSWLSPCGVEMVENVAPASSERNTPPSAASTIAYTRFESAPDTLTPILPSGLAGSPGLPDSSVHVVPPLVDLKSPLDSPPLNNSHGLRNT